MTQSLSALLKRVEEATGPDRELDLEICRALDPEQFEHERNQARLRALGPDEILSPTYTSSLDAALALVEKELPGWRLRLETGSDYSSASFAYGWGGRAKSTGTEERSDSNAALCIIASFLRFKITEQAP